MIGASLIKDADSPPPPYTSASINVYVDMWMKVIYLRKVCIIHVLNTISLLLHVCAAARPQATLTLQQKTEYHAIPSWVYAISRARISARHVRIRSALT